MTLELLGYRAAEIGAICIELLNVSLLSGLIYLYIKSYRQIKIGFTIGLMLFASFLLLRSIFAVALLILDSDMISGNHEFLSSIIEFVALAILLKVTWDY